MGTRYGPAKLRVPKGFPVLLQRFTREVLREQPSDIASFGAGYFRTLLDQRTSTGEDPLKFDPFDEAGYNVPAPAKKVLRPISSQTRKNDIRQEKAAVQIQAGFRGYHVRKQARQECEKKRKMQNDAAAVKIQAQYRGYKTRKNLKAPISIPPNDGHVKKTVDGEALARSGEEEENAAVRIQASYRGYQARKSLKPEIVQDEVMKDTPTQEMEYAAVKIQASYRGHKTRKHLKVNTLNLQQDEKLELVSTELERDNEHPPMAISEPVANIKDPQSDTEAAHAGETEDKDVMQETTSDNQSSTNAEDMERDAAARKIQASYLRHRARKQLKGDANDGTSGLPGSEGSGKLADDPSFQASGDGVVSIERKEQPSPQQKETILVSKSTAENNDEGIGNVAATAELNREKEASAMKIQAHYRGYRTRKQLQNAEGPKEVKPDLTTEVPRDLTEKD